MIRSEVQRWVITMFGSISEVVDILMLRSPIFEVLYSPELNLKILYGLCAFLCVRFIRFFFGCTHTFNVHLE